MALSTLQSNYQTYLKFKEHLKKDGKFKLFAIKCVQEIIKEEMGAIVSNSKFNITNFKISLDEIKGFLILTINNKYAKNAPILQFLLRPLANSIAVFSHSFC